MRPRSPPEATCHPQKGLEERANPVSPIPHWRQPKTSQWRSTRLTTQKLDSLLRCRSARRAKSILLKRSSTTRKRRKHRPTCPSRASAGTPLSRRSGRGIRGASSNDFYVFFLSRFCITWLDLIFCNDRVAFFYKRNLNVMRFGISLIMWVLIVHLFD